LQIIARLSTRNATYSTNWYPTRTTRRFMFARMLIVSERVSERVSEEVSGERERRDVALQLATTSAAMPSQCLNSVPHAHYSIDSMPRFIEEGDSHHKKHQATREWMWNIFGHSKQAVDRHLSKFCKRVVDTRRAKPTTASPPSNVTDTVVCHASPAPLLPSCSNSSSSCDNQLLCCCLHSSHWSIVVHRTTVSTLYSWYAVGMSRDCGCSATCTNDTDACAHVSIIG
jgi:hypothetical protein